MRKFLVSISIENLNTVQRIGYFVSVVGCLVLIVLHNPMSSYDIYKDKGGSIVDPNSGVYISRITGKPFRYEGNASVFMYGIGEDDAGAECLKAAELFYSVVEEPWESPMREQVQNRSLATMSRLDCWGDWFKPFSEWKTISPIIPWLGKVVNLLFAVISVVGLGCFWLFVFRTTKPVGVDD